MGNWGMMNWGLWILGTLADAATFGLALPAGMFFLASVLDERLALPEFTVYPYTQGVGLVLMLASLVFWAWSVVVFFRLGQGSSSPLIPPAKLVIAPPYSYCRNPITFGAIPYYFGLGILVGSCSFLGLSVALTVLLVLYLKFVEEARLEKRFGEEYVRYKERTSFLIPWPRAKM